ncbi:hypothetical protein AtEden1_Chr1g0031461 [Arabidopsis thaliana]
MLCLPPFWQERQGQKHICMLHSLRLVLFKPNFNFFFRKNRKRAHFLFVLKFIKMFYSFWFC